MELDLMLACASGLVVIGLIFNAFAFVAFTFKLDNALAWIFSLFGTGFWILAAVLFYFFLCDPQPRHSRRR